MFSDGRSGTLNLSVSSAMVQEERRVSSGSIGRVIVGKFKGCNASTGHSPSFLNHD